VNENLPTLLDETIAAVVTTVTLTGRQVPMQFEGTAAQLLTDLWRAGLRYDVQPEDWRASCSLPTACLDVLTLVERRRSTP
jgi:hypothetical protein